LGRRFQAGILPNGDAVVQGEMEHSGAVETGRSAFIFGPLRKGGPNAAAADPGAGFFQRYAVFHEKLDDVLVILKERYAAAGQHVVL
jgi:hypothetical protein